MVRRVLVRNQRWNGNRLLLFYKHRRMKQTAVEWLIEQIGDMYLHSVYDKEFEQAKEMEKEQNQLWWAKGWQEGHISTLQENIETFNNK